MSNFVSGIILLIERPISQATGSRSGPDGLCPRHLVRSTRIETFDRTDVIVPNADLVSGQVVNWTRGNSVGRIIAPVSVMFGSDVDRVLAILREVAENHPMVLLSPPPVVILQNFGPDVLNFEIRAIVRDVNFGVQIRSELNVAIAKRFYDDGIEFAGGARANGAAGRHAKSPEPAAAEPTVVFLRRESGPPVLPAPADPGQMSPRHDPPAFSRGCLSQDLAGASDRPCARRVDPGSGDLLSHGGGQPGDRASGLGRRAAGHHRHRQGRGRRDPAAGRAEAALPPPGTPVTQHLDWDLRLAHMRTHTALHLLSVVVPLPVTGGAIGAGQGRLDFLMPEPPADVAALEAALNALVARDLAVTTEWITDAELDANRGLVKTMSVQPPREAARFALSASPTVRGPSTCSPAAAPTWRARPRSAASASASREQGQAEPPAVDPAGSG